MSKEELINQFGTSRDVKVLMKHNSLVKAKYSLTLVQNRVFEFLLYKFQKESDGVLTCEVNRDEFKKLIKKEKDRTIKGISDLLESLRIKEILIAEKIDYKDKYKWHRFGLINGSTYDEERDAFTIKATEEIYALIQDYYDKREGHTPINLIIKLGMNNYYAQRLYDLLRVWSGTKQVINYKVKDLKALLQIEEKYSLYGDFKKRVITPAIKELNSTGLFNIEFKERKVNRRVVSIDFIVKDLDKRVYFNNLNDTKTESVDEAKPDPSEDKPNVKSSFYVPTKKLFTPKTLESFEQDFGNYDFKIKTNEEALQEAIFATLKKDNEEKIKVKQYNYFKTTLQDMLNKKALEKQQQSYNPKSKPAVFHNINNPTARYTGEELMEMIQKSQKAKFGK